MTACIILSIGPVFNSSHFGEVLYDVGSWRSAFSHEGRHEIRDLETIAKVGTMFSGDLEAASPTEVLRDLSYSATLTFPASGNCLAIAAFAMPVAKWQPFASNPSCDVPYDKMRSQR